MGEDRFDNLIDETLSTMEPVKLPEDLRFDAAKIMRLAKMEEEEEAAANRSSSFSGRLKAFFKNPTRLAAAAAAFIILLGVYGITKQPDVIVDPGEVITPPEYQAGLTIYPEESFEEMLAQAMEDESFAAQFNEEDKGYGYVIRSVQDCADGIEFMVYYYESEEESLAGTVNEENVRSIIWQKESL